MPGSIPQLPLLTTPVHLLQTPALAGVCVPVQLNMRLLSLVQLVNNQAAEAQNAEQASLVAQSVVFSIYQIISHMVAMECWHIFNAQCQQEGYIIIDNLTGIMSPMPGREKAAQTIVAALCKSSRQQKFALNVYQLTSALLHSFPHLHSGQHAEIKTPYRDSLGEWHMLGPFSLKSLLEDLARLLTGWS